MKKLLLGWAAVLGVASGLGAQQPDAAAPRSMPAATPEKLPAVDAKAPSTPAMPVTGCTTGSCNVGSCCDCLCGPAGRAWISGEWIYARTSGQHLPPLITTSPAGTPRATAGTLFAPGTTILGGGENVNNDWRSGFRLNGGLWLDECQKFGIEGNFLYLGESNSSTTAGSDGSQIIMRPFINALTGAQDSQLVSFPGALAGSTTVNASSNLIGGGGNFISNLCCTPCSRFDLTYGYRYLNLRDEVTITEDLTAISPNPGTRFLITDRFKTSNNFHGPVVGFNWEQRFNRCFFGVRSSLAMGVNHVVTNIEGSTTIIPAGGAASTFPGGLLTQTSNIGTYTNDYFSVMPEIGVRLGCQITPALRGYVGYNYLVWTKVQRAGDQIDLRVNTNLIAPANGLGGPALPAYSPTTSTFQMHAISVGAEYRFR